MSARADPRSTGSSPRFLVPGLLLLAVLAAVAALALRGSSRLAQQPEAQLTATTAAGELAASRRAGQTFLAEQNGLYQIDVRLARRTSSAGQSLGTLVLHVSAEPFVGPDLAQATAEVSNLGPDGFLAFQFVPLAATAGRPLAFWLEAPNTPAGPGLMPLGAAQDVYPGGAAAFDPAASGQGVQDLAFRLYYRSGLLGALGVLLARPAAGRPGIFGRPELYALLLLAYLLGVAGLLVLAYRRLRL
jgi:type II secretory pathway pseudopilin PulG